MAQHTKKVSKWPEGAKKHAATIREKQVAKKQEKNKKRGRKGHSPKQRKILK